MPAMQPPRPSPPHPPGCRTVSLLTLSRAAILALFTALAAACAGPNPEAGGRSEEQPRAVVDDIGREIRLARAPERVVSLIPATTEMISALGAAELLVARTDFDRDSTLAHLPSVGPGLTPSVEWLISLDPDLVIAWPDAPDRGLAHQLERLGVPVYAARIESLDDILSTTRRVGALLGRTPAADSLVREIEGGLDEVRRAVEGRERPVVLYLIGLEPPMTVGSGTFIDELIEIAGGRNLFNDLEGWPQVSIEEVIRRRPEIVVLPQGEGNTTPERLARRTGWRELEAVREGAIITVDAETMHRPGTRVVETARRLAELLHPGSPSSVVP